MRCGTIVHPYSVDASSTPSPRVVTTKGVSRDCVMGVGDAKLPLVENAALREIQLSAKKYSISSEFNFILRSASS